MQPPKLSRQFFRFRYCHIWILIGFVHTLAWFPLPLLHLAGIVFGQIAYYLHIPRRKITLRNLSACFPTKTNSEIRTLARKHFRILTVAMFTIGVAWWADKPRLERLTRVHNREVVDNIRKRGDNIIFLTPHFVGLEHGAIYLSMTIPIIALYQHHKNLLLDKLIKKRRNRFNSALYKREDSAIKSIITLIRRGNPFYYLPDQDPGKKKCVFAPFFTIPTATFASLGRIARISNATIIPCWTRILSWGRGYEITFGEPITVFAPDSGGDDEIATATRMNQIVESLILNAPEQYLWSHKRFKTRPAGDPPFYQ